MKKLFIAALIPGLLAAVSCKKENIEKPGLTKVMSTGNEPDSLLLDPAGNGVPDMTNLDKGGEDQPGPGF